MCGGVLAVSCSTEHNDLTLVLLRVILMLMALQVVVEIEVHSTLFTCGVRLSNDSLSTTTSLVLFQPWPLFHPLSSGDWMGCGPVKKRSVWEGEETGIWAVARLWRERRRA